MITAQKITVQKPLVLVGGGAGFIGSFLCETLLWQNCRVICLDNLSGGKKQNLNKCLANQDFTFINQDLTKPLLETLINQDFSYIFDLVGFKESSQNLFRLAEKTGAKLLLVFCAQREPPTFNFPKVDFRAIRLAEVYGPRMDLRRDTPFVRLIKAAVEGGPLVVPQKETVKALPLFISDVVYGLTKAMFGTGTKGKVFGLMNPRGISLLEFAQKLQGCSGGELKIEFLSSEQESKVVTENFEKIKEQPLDQWHPNVGIEEGISQTLRFFRKKERTVSDKKRRKSVTFLPLVILFLFFVSFLFLIFDGLLGVINLQKAQQAFFLADFKKTAGYSRKAEKFLKTAERRLPPLEITKPWQRHLSVGKNLAAGLAQISLAGGEASLLTDYVFRNANTDVQNLISEIKIDLAQAYYYLSLVEGEQKRGSLINQTKRLSEKIPEVRNLILQTKKGLEIIPWIIGLEERRTYLVLLQNNNELRPTGGFIGSFALLTFEKGRLSDFEIQDVYWADGQLKGHIEPPPELKKYLGEANWYLRDSNWSPDFPTSALKARWFLEKEIGRTVDGVLGVNLFLVQRLLEATGEIEVPDFKEKINPANLFERAEYYSEAGFFPGSTQKQDFLGSLSRALFEKLKSSEGKEQLAVGRALYQSLVSKDLLLYFDNSQVMEVIADLGWGGGIKNVQMFECSNAQCVTDYLMIVESNVGVNKVNFFVERKLKHEVKIDADGAISEKLEITYQNDSPSQNFPGGLYKNYLRILVPQGTQLEKLSIEGKEVGKEKIDQEIIASKTSFGFLVEVPVKEKRLVEISYQLADKIALSEKSQYLLLWQKQPGVKEESVNLRFSPPSGITVLSVSPEATAEGSSYLFKQKFAQDIVFEVFLGK